jgi:hypothetical protein
VLSNQKLQSRLVFALPIDSLPPTDLHERRDVHGEVREREHAAYDGVLWQSLVNQDADTASPYVLGHPIQQVFGLLRDINGSEQADTQLDGVGKSGGFSAVYDFSRVTHKSSVKWKMIAQLRESVNSTKGLVLVRILRWVTGMHDVRICGNGLSKNSRAGRDAHLDHDETQESLHGIRADAHSITDLFACKTL